MSFNSQESAIANETFGKDASFKLPQLIGSMSISPSGRDVVLGSKEGLRIIDLDSPYSPPRFLPHRTSWEVADVQWSPFADRDYWVVSTSNQKALVWNLNLFGWRNSIQHVLHGHTRAITDINFSAHHPDKLATCAVDSFVHCWDLRCPERPVSSFSDWFAGATQVKWSRQDDHVIASSHDKFLHIWDDRNGAYPARTIEAHETKIYGIDWNRFEPSKIVTCSLDKTIKFWNTDNEEDIPERVIQTSFPVWRARHTPFGWGLMVMPQRGNGDLHLYDRRPIDGHLESGRVKPVHVFPGHKGHVKEFLWRFYGTVKDGIDHRDFQLVSWGTDRELRLHAVSRSTLASVGYEKGVSRNQRLRFTRRGAKYRTFRDEPTEQDQSFVFPPRTDSFPSSNQFLRVRGRPSTNMGISRTHLTQLRNGPARGRRTDMHGKGSARPEADPISWMKSVKITSWDTDTIAEEITTVGDRFKNIEFETIDITRRRATLSLQTPWAEQGSSSYIRMELRFPKEYPHDAPVIVHILKTSSISTEIQHKLANDVRQIADAHRAKGRGSVEAIVRYLLKDQTLEQIIQWISRDVMTDSKIIEAANALDDASDSDDDQLVSSTTVAQANANFNVPHAKGCAAVWAENGKLVCFFRQASKEPTSFLTTLGTGQLDDTDSSKLFGGFGKFQVDSPSRKAREGVSAEPESLSSDESEHSSVFSSSTSSSDSAIEFEERTKFGPWQRNTLDSVQKGKSGDGSQKSTTLDGTRLDDLSRKARICIYDCSDLLPATRPAAMEYSIDDDLHKTLENNHEVASKHALPDAAAVWNFARLLISASSSTQTPENALKDPKMQPILGAAAVFMSEHMKSEGPSRSGSSLPSHFIPAIIQMLEAQADVQMLALTSALFLRVQIPAIPLSQLSSDDIYTGANTPIYYARESDLDSTGARDVNRQLTRFGHKSSARTTTSFRTGVDHGDQPDLSSSAPQSTLNGMFLVSQPSSSGAPSISAHDNAAHKSAAESTVVSLAGSPESQRLIKKPDSRSIFSMTSAGKYRLSRSRPASPPSGDRMRLTVSSKSLRASPDDSFLDEAKLRLRTSLSLANVSSLGIGNTRTPTDSRRAHQDPRHGSVNVSPVKKRKGKLKTTLINDDRGRNVPKHTVSSARDFADSCQQCLDYIRQYIPLLESWQLWCQRAELLKLYTQVSALLAPLDERDNPPQSQHKVEEAIELRPNCPRCGKALERHTQDNRTKRWSCKSGSCQARLPRSTAQHRCIICESVITGLSIPCLSCGHISCYSCAQGWFGTMPLRRDTSRSGSTTSSNAKPPEFVQNQENLPSCPAGCDCHCAVASDWQVTGSLVHAEDKPTEQPVTVAKDEHSDGAQTPPVNAETQRIRRGHSISNNGGAPESALNALLALQRQSRNRSISSNVTGPTTSRVSTEGGIHGGQHGRDNSITAADDLLPWSNIKGASLARGQGGGLSRGLSSKGSDATIRHLSNR